MRSKDIDDILNDLGVDDESPVRRAPKSKVRGHRVDKEEKTFSSLPPAPSGQRRYGSGASEQADPAVKQQPSAIPSASVGAATRAIYVPEPRDGDTPGGERLSSLLVERGAVSNEQLSGAIQVCKQTPGQRLVDVLVDQGADENDIQKVVAEVASLPFERIDLAKGLDGGFDGKLLQRLGVDFCKANMVMPIRIEGRRPVVGFTRPDDVSLIDEVRTRLDVPSVKLVLVSNTDIRAVLEAQGETMEDDVDLSELLSDVDEADVEVSEGARGQNEEVDLHAQAAESPVIRYVNYIIQTAVKEGASDIHVEPADKKLKVRFRIDGVLFEMMNPPASMSAAITSRLKIMANLDISERRIPQDGRIRCVVQGRKLDLRMSTLPNTYGEKTVLRILDTKSINVQLEDLGFDEDTLTIWKEQVKAPHGITLVTGPTGSGKTTTLYSSLRQLDKNKLNISTVEDPVEYHLEGVTQTQMHEKIGMTFSKALKALLRQDPDVIMLGEIRDMETAHIAVQAALTGHLVLSTLHTNDAPSSITRLVNIGLEPFLVGAAVNGVLAQRLLRRLCKVCKAQKPPSDEMADFLEIQGMDPSTNWEPVGCDKCRNTGYSGRVGIYELLAIDDQTRDIIARNPNVSEFRRLCIERGMRTLRMDGIEKVRAGLTTVQEVLRVTESAH